MTGVRVVDTLNTFEANAEVLPTPRRSGHDYRDRADRERQIAFWEARTTEHRKKAIELEQVMVAFSQLLDLWAGADSDERSRLAASLFQYLVIDLDKEQIVDFRLHAWADQYLCLRAELYDDGDSGAFGGGSEDEGSAEGNKNRSTAVESDEAIDDPKGLLRVA